MRSDPLAELTMVAAEVRFDRDVLWEFATGVHEES